MFGKNVTWALVLQDNSIQSIQEPICEMLIDKNEFHTLYGEFMDTLYICVEQISVSEAILDGRDLSSYVDFFWRQSPINMSCLEFVDSDARLDIYDFFRDGDLIPDMDEVHSGEWKFK